MRSSKADKNFLSLDSTNAVWFAGTDDWRYEPGPIPTDILPEKPEDWDSALKFSHRGPTSLRGLRASQGRENSVDINNQCHHLDISGEFGFGTVYGDQCITVKGGSSNITISGIIYSTSKNADCVIGQWSDQSCDTSRFLDFSGLSRADGKPVTFVFSRVGSPLMAALGKPKDIKLPEGAEVLFFKSIANQCYYCLKFLAVKAGLLKIKV